MLQGIIIAFFFFLQSKNSLKNANIPLSSHFPHYLLNSHLDPFSDFLVFIFFCIEMEHNIFLKKPNEMKSYKLQIFKKNK